MDESCSPQPPKTRRGRLGGMMRSRQERKKPREGGAKHHRRSPVACVVGSWLVRRLYHGWWFWCLLVESGQRRRREETRNKIIIISGSCRIPTRRCERPQGRGQAQRSPWECARSRCGHGSSERGCLEEEISGEAAWNSYTISMNISIGQNIV